jgi:hypothetical protein
MTETIGEAIAPCQRRIEMPSWKLHKSGFNPGEIVSVNARLSMLGRIL